MKKLSLILVAFFCGLLFCSCSKDELTTNVTPLEENTEIETRAGERDIMWMCREMGCSMINSGWRNTCVACGKKYNKYHGSLITSIQVALASYVEARTTIGGAPANDINIGNRIELPDGYFFVTPPEAWFGTAKALKYYTPLTTTMKYYSDRIYAEGVDLGWYRTVRILYPGFMSVVTAQSKFDRFIVTYGSSMRDSFGSGLMDGSKAAIQAFANR